LIILLYSAQKITRTCSSGFNCDLSLVPAIHSAIILQNSDVSLVVVDLVVHSPLLPLLAQMLHVHFYEVLDDSNFFILFFITSRWSSLEAAVDRGMLYRLRSLFQL